MDFVIAQPKQVSLEVKGSLSAFPVHRVYCVGRNYAAHAIEMGGDPDREPPFFFQKNPDNIPLATALDCIYGYGVGLDMTRRDLQGQAKEAGRPWEVGKAFESSAPASPLVPAAEIGHPSAGAIWLDVNGARRQAGEPVGRPRNRGSPDAFG